MKERIKILLPMAVFVVAITTAVYFVESYIVKQAEIARLNSLNEPELVVPTGKIDDIITAITRELASEKELANEENSSVSLVTSDINVINDLNQNVYNENDL